MRTSLEAVQPLRGVRVFVSTAQGGRQIPGSAVAHAGKTFCDSFVQGQERKLSRAGLLTGTALHADIRHMQGSCKMVEER